MNAVRAEYFERSPPISTCFRAEVHASRFAYRDRGHSFGQKRQGC